MKTFTLLTCVLLLSRAAFSAEPTPELLRAEEVRIAAITQASKSFIAVFAQEGNGGGSGVVISADGYALTNFHVAKPAGMHMKCGMNDGRLYDAVLVGLDPTGDIALIKLLGREDFIPAMLANSDAVRAGDWCFAVGNPFLLATDFQPTVTYGIVSGVHRCQYPAGTLLEYTDAIQTDASINPGNSGGPLFNARGELIGIVGSGSFDKRGRVNVGVGYAISINQVKNFLGCLRSGRLVDHATLGATVATNDKGRVYVNDILDTSDAFRRGLRYNDDIIAFGGRTITSANGFKSVLGTFPKGWVVPLTYRRQGRETTVQVRLAGLLTLEQLNDKATKAFSEEAHPKPKTPPPEKELPLPDKQSPEKTPATPADKATKEETKIPAEIAKYIETRNGFANYYFNRQARDRVWKKLQSHVSNWPTENWQVSGELTAGGKFELALSDATSEGKFPTGNIEVESTKDYDQQLGPPNSGGLLAALHLWRLFVTQGPEKYGDVSYYGTRPLKLGETQHDLLTATRNVAQLTVICHHETGLPLRVEFLVDDELDPCELHFVEWKTEANQSIPSRIEIWHAGKPFGTIHEIAKGTEVKP